MTKRESLYCLSSAIATDYESVFPPYLPLSLAIQIYFLLCAYSLYQLFKEEEERERLPTTNNYPPQTAGQNMPVVYSQVPKN